MGKRWPVASNVDEQAVVGFVFAARTAKRSDACLIWMILVTAGGNTFTNLAIKNASESYPSGREYFSRSLANRCPLSRAALAKSSGMTL
jgi:hypothetical protein